MARRLTAGQVTLVTVSGWGFVGDFLAFLDEIGFCALLGIEGRGFKRVMIPIARLIMTYQMKVLLGISSINLVPTKLFRQAADGECVFKGEHWGKKKVGKDGRVRWEGQASVVGVANLTSYDQYGDEEHARRAGRRDFEGNVLNAVVVTKWQGEEYEVGEERVFLSSLSVESPLEVLDPYDLRSLIENTAFRELKQGWNLKSYPKKTRAAVTGHVFLTLLTFTLANAFRSSLGQELAKHGIRRQRAEQEDDNVIVFADDYYAVFHIEELVILLGVVPKVLLRANPREVSRTYGLALAALSLWFNLSRQQLLSRHHARTEGQQALPPLPSTSAGKDCGRPVPREPDDHRRQRVRIAALGDQRRRRRGAAGRVGTASST